MLTLMIPVIIIIIADEILPDREEEEEEDFCNDLGLVLEKRHNKGDTHEENIVIKEEIIPSHTRQMMKDLAGEMTAKNNFPHGAVVDTAGNEGEDDRNPTLLLRDDPCRILNTTVQRLAW